MSRLSRVPLPIPAGIEVAIAADGEVTVTGKLGTLVLPGDHNVAISQDDGKLAVRRVRDTKHARSIAGTYVRRLGNLLTGVSEGFTRTLELHGTGYRANVQGATVNLELGFSHPVTYELPAGVTAETPAQNRITLKGIDKAVIGQAAADIRAKRPPEPYKGKGVRHEGETIIVKQGKKKQ